MRLALLPARGGSKRLPRKNVIPFAGRPMIAWTLEAAQTANLFDEILVSTDDKEIAAVAAEWGAAVQRRPPGISDDAATLLDVIQHVLASRSDIEELCMLLANCPLRTAQDIVRSAETWRRDTPPALLSVVGYGWTHPLRAQRWQADGRFEPLLPEMSDLKSQYYPETVCLTGAIYWGRPQILRTASTLAMDGIRGFRMPWHRAVDIDTPEDLRLAECIRFSLDRGFRFDDEHDRDHDVR